MPPPLTRLPQVMPADVAPVAAPAVSREVITIEGIQKRFPIRRGWLDSLRHPLRRDYTAVLRDVSLEVREGEFFGLLGPNGAGKTTLFKILSGLVLPDAGAAEVLGFDVVRQIAAVRARLTPVGNEERSLFWRISAWENLRAYATLHGLRGSALKSRIDEVLAIVELTDTGNKMVGQFSSGMKQRLLIARALLARPRILLLDEPTRSLDPVSARRFRRFLREEVAGRQGCTVLLATHNAEEALDLCDRVGVLNRGRLLRVGTPGELMTEMGDEQYRLLVRSEDWEHFVLAARRRGWGDPAALEVDEQGWSTAVVRIGGGLDGAGDGLAYLVERGVRVGGFEPVRFSLADLIERIVAESGEVANA